MKAVGVTDFGAPEALQVLDLPAPQADPGEIRIRVRAATVNPVDSLIRRGLAVAPGSRPPYVPGMEAAGVVDQIGEGAPRNVRRFPVGPAARRAIWPELHRAIENAQIRRTQLALEPITLDQRFDLRAGHIALFLC